MTVTKQVNAVVIIINHSTGKDLGVDILDALTSIQDKEKDILCIQDGTAIAAGNRTVFGSGSYDYRIYGAESMSNELLVDEKENIYMMVQEQFEEVAINLVTKPDLGFKTDGAINDKYVAVNWYIVQ